MVEKINNPNIITFVSLDFVGSTQLQIDISKVKYSQIINNSRNTVESVFSTFNAEPEYYNWQGDGISFYFRNFDGVDKAVEASLQTIEKFVTEKISVRISAAVDNFDFANDRIIDYGKLDSQEFSKSGHLIKICPPNALVITQNIFNNISKKLRSKFVFAGAGKRDNTPFYISPAAYKNKIDKRDIVPEKEDINYEIYEYLKYFESPEIKNIKFAGIRQIENLAEPEILDIFTEPDILYKIPVTRSLKNIAKNNFSGYPYQGSISVEPDFSNENQIFLGSSSSGNLSSSSGFSSVSENIISEELPENRDNDIPYQFQYEEIKLSIGEALKKFKHLVILGDPGSGKTTLLKWLGLIVKNGGLNTKKYLNIEEELFPVIISIGKLFFIFQDKKHNIDFTEALARYLKSCNFPLPVKTLKKIFDSRNCLFLFDGLDEIPDESDRINAGRWIEQILSKYKNHRFIITSRIVGFSGFSIGTEGLICSLSPFNRKQIIKFTTKFYDALERKHSDDDEYINTIVAAKMKSFAESLEKNLSLQNFVTNPLLLAIAAIIHRQDTQLPDYRIQLYEICSRTLIEKWNDIRKLTVSYKKTPAIKMNFEKEALKIFPVIAYQLHKNYPSNLMPENDLKKILAETFAKISGNNCDIEKTIEDLLDKMKNNIQLFLPRGFDEWGFMHQTFQEYFTTIYLSNVKNYAKEIKKFLFNPRWEEVIKMFAGNLSVIYHRDWETEDFLNLILDAKDKLNTELLNKHIFLGAQCLNETSGVDKKIENRIFEEIKKIFFRAEDFWLYRIADLCKEIKGSELYNKILGLMIDCIEKERKMIGIIYYLGEIRDESTAEILEKLLIKYYNQYNKDSSAQTPFTIFYLIAEALLKINDNSAAYKLLCEIVEEKIIHNFFTSAHCLKLLLKYNFNEYVDLLISRIKKNITEFGHLEAETLEIIKSIENIDNKKLFDVMFGLFQQNNNVNNRVICKFIGKNSDRKIREYLLENVKNTGTPYQLKINSILALGAVKEQSIRDLIDSIYENHNEDLFIKQIALISISNIDIDFAFKKYLENPSREIGFLDLIYENLENIQNIKEIKNIEFLLENIENNEFLSSIIYQNDKSQIITALGKIGGHEAVIKLFEILTTDSQEILCLLNCEKAARELGKIGDKKIIPELQKIYNENNDADLRSALLEAIWNLSGK